MFSPRSDNTGIKYQEESDIDLDLINENIKINYLRNGKNNFDSDQLL